MAELEISELLRIKYSETRLKQNLDITEAYLWRETVTVAVKKKDKVAYRVSIGTAALILNLGNKWK